MQSFISLLHKRPFWVVSGLMLVVAALAIGATSISLSTGNDTLIDPTSSIYQDNRTYQEHFGIDPIVLVLEGDQDDLLSMASLSVLNDLTTTIERHESIRYMSSPITVLEATNNQRVAQFEQALIQMATGLQTIADTMATLDVPGGWDPQQLDDTMSVLILAQENMNTGLSGEVEALTTLVAAVQTERSTLEQQRDALDPIVDETQYLSLTRTITVLSNVDTVLTQFIQLNNEFAGGTAQTAIALDAIRTQLSSLSGQLMDMTTNLGQLVDTIALFATNLNKIATSFDGIGATFPEEESTLQQLVRPNGVDLNPMLVPFFLDDTHLFVRIVPAEGITDAELKAVLDDIDAVLADTIHADALISGKPVLDLDIRASMMDSMQVMMITAALVMIVVLLVLFPVKMRLLPLMVVLTAVVVTVGIMGHVSIPLTMVSMAVFPVLIGLGIDYSIQFHSRYQEELEGGMPHA